MNFLEAVAEMRKGKKAKPCKGEMSKIHISSGLTAGQFFWENHEPVELTLSLLESNSWEVVEEKKTLSDKIQNVGVQVYNEMNHPKANKLNVEDVKEAIKEFIDWINSFDTTEAINQSIFEQKAKEIFGERLI